MDVPDLYRSRRCRLQPAGDVGRVHHQFRLLDRYRTRGYADLRDPLFVPGRFPHDHLPLRGSDDCVRGHDGRTFPDSTPWPAMEILLADSLSELALRLAAVQEPAGVGRVRDPHLLHDIEHVPVHRTDPG